MPIERERKFEVRVEHLPTLNLDDGHVIEAGYFTREPPAIRVTVRDHGRGGKEARYKFCLKGPGLEERAEYEYSIPAQDALEMLELSPTYLKKHRFLIDGWEVDRFIFRTEGGVDTFWMAEWEESTENKELPSPLPPWIGRGSDQRIIEHKHGHCLEAWPPNAA